MSSNAGDAAAPVLPPKTDKELHQREVTAAANRGAIELQVRKARAERKRAREERSRNGAKGTNHEDETTGTDSGEDIDTEEEVFVTLDYATYGNDRTQKEFDDRQDRLRQFKAERTKEGAVARG
ncbi:hypothetical protein HDU88_002371 [Geranomyces variabilis]|nr:hypothetical protein HDU88_002371 [Geranomyces variabilis]